MFNKNLKYLRQKSGLSQKLVAEYLNISPQSVSKWEKGDALPSIDFLPELAECLQCDINDFFVKDTKCIVDYKVFDCFLTLMIDLIYNDCNNSNDVAAFVLQNPDIIDKTTDICNELMTQKTLNIKIVQGLFGCNEKEAKSLITNLEKGEMLEKLDNAETYYIVRDAVEGFITVVRLQKVICDLINKEK